MAKMDPHGKETADLLAFREGARERVGGQHLYARLLGLRSIETRELLHKIEAGLPYRSFETLQKNLDLDAGELALLSGIRLRTLARRREEGRLTPEESDRLLRVSRVFGRALSLFDGDLRAVRTWISTPAPALAGRTPQAVATTEVGAREVEDLLGRLEHGVFS